MPSGPALARSEALCETLEPGGSTEVLRKLDDPSECDRVLEELVRVAWRLALTRAGTRLVQKALDVARGPRRDALIAELAAHSVELYESAHGNHVLSRLVEVMPSAVLGPFVERLALKGVMSIAKHRFGCRVLERLIEHCSETELGSLLDEIIVMSETLSIHAYGNYVVQAIFEHCKDARKREVLLRLLPHMPRLAMHRTASHVVQRALDYTEEAYQRAIVDVLLRAPSPHSLVDIACSKYGSYVAQQLAAVRGLQTEVARRLSAGLEELERTAHGQRVAQAFKLTVPTDSSR